MTEQQLPEGWQLVKFGDIAKHISKRVEPSETDLDVYVGLEHLDPDSLKIKRHGVPSDVAGQKLLVKKGQIIFGKRRAYQRKVAVADWDCICSAHAMVLEANEENVIPEFLPFFMLSNVFMERAVSISEGSLSPTIKWKTLERQSFAIPKKEGQKHLIKLFRGVQLAILNTEEAIESIGILKSAVVASFQKGEHKECLFQDTALGQLPSDWSVVSLKDIFENKDKMRVPIKSSDRKKISGDVPYYGASGIIDYVDRHIFDETLLLLSEDGANLVDRNTPIAFKVEGKSFVNNHAHVYRPKELIDVDYVAEMIERMDVSQYLTGTAQPKINKAKADSILVPYPPLDERKKIVKVTNNINAQKQALIDKHDHLLKLQRTLIEREGR